MKSVRLSVAKRPGKSPWGIVMLNRRGLLQTAGAGAAALLGAGSVAIKARAAERRIKAVCFDAFPIFNPMPILASARQLSPELGSAWFQKIFSDTWLRTTAQQYVEFSTVLAETLDYSSSTIGITLTGAARDQLLGSFSSLDVWPDVNQSLTRLRRAGLRLAFLSNMTEPMLSSNLRRNGIAPLFEASLSTDEVRAFKPSPKAYALAAERLGLRTDEILFVAFAAWDAAGAAWFGYPTAWVNRARQPAEPGAPPVPVGNDLKLVCDMTGV
jgi:2-haloacid dehalogenase